MARDISPVAMFIGVRVVRGYRQSMLAIWGQMEQKTITVMVNTTLGCHHAIVFDQPLIIPSLVHPLTATDKMQAIVNVAIDPTTFFLFFSTFHLNNSMHLKVIKMRSNIRLPTAKVQQNLHSMNSFVPNFKNPE